MTKEVLIEHNINIDNFPIIETKDTTGFTEITIGDLHANAIKLLYFLVRHGICAIAPEDYEQLVRIYKTPIDQLTADHIAVYNQLIQKMRVINRDSLVRFIGDELCDRGTNDYFVLKIFEKLVKEDVKFEILLSNHGGEFIVANEATINQPGQPCEFKTVRLQRQQATSMCSLGQLIQKGLVEKDKVDNIVTFQYKNYVKAISYSLDQVTGGITIFSHAAIGLDSIVALAILFEVDYKDSTSMQLANTIDEINRKFAIVLQKNRLHEYYNAESKTTGYDPYADVLTFIMWNRDYNTLRRPAIHNRYPMSFVHGHESTAENQGHHYNLDNYLGKSLELHEHTYNILQTDEQSTIPNYYRFPVDHLRRLTQPIGNIPPGTRWLHLSDTNLGYYSNEVLGQLFERIPPSVTTLDLSYNYFSRKLDDPGFAAIFAKIPATVTTLNLSGNRLNSMHPAQLKQILSSIPKTVTSLNLSENNLLLKPVDRLLDIISVVPASTRIFFDAAQSITREKLAKSAPMVPNYGSLTRTSSTFKLDDQENFVQSTSSSIVCSSEKLFETSDLSTFYNPINWDEDDEEEDEDSGQLVFIEDFPATDSGVQSTSSASPVNSGVSIPFSFLGNFLVKSKGSRPASPIEDNTEEETETVTP